MKLKKNSYRNIVEKALKEDLPGKDITTSGLDIKPKKVKADIVAKDSGIISGTEIGEYVFKKIDPDTQIKILKKDRQSVQSKDNIMEISGTPQGLLKAERTAINFLSHLSGIATLTSEYVKKVKKISPKTEILDTRKTIPGLRKLEKYAVRCGGGKNHRLTLSHRVLLKENHLTCSKDSIQTLLKKIRERTPKNIKVEIEVENIDQIKKILKISQDTPDIIMVDNFTTEDIKIARDLVKSQKPDIKIEVSGGVTLENIEEFASTGPDFISVGRLTNSAPAIDFSMIIRRFDE
ncbi:MAG: carboxylating nicotinate-nucleotide diphosphorylase [Elusimicrobiota bacterium]